MLYLPFYTRRWQQTQLLQVIKIVKRYVGCISESSLPSKSIGKLVSLKLERPCSWRSVGTVTLLSRPRRRSNPREVWVFSRNQFQERRGDDIAPVVESNERRFYFLQIVQFQNITSLDRKTSGGLGRYFPCTAVVVSIFLQVPFKCLSVWHVSYVRKTATNHLTDLLRLSDVESHYHNCWPGMNEKWQIIYSFFRAEHVRFTYRTFKIFRQTSSIFSPLYFHVRRTWIFGILLNVTELILIWIYSRSKIIDTY